jgi:SAM-dependent methyltransferase
LLDVGGGNGVVTAALTEAGYDVTLLEPGLQGAINAKSRGIENVLCSTFEAAGFPDAAIPAAGLFDVIEHIEDDLGFLTALRTKLTPGGKLYLTVPAFPGLWSFEDELAGHFRRYTKKTLCQLLYSADFDVDYCSYFFWFLPLPVFAFRALPSKLGISGSQDSQDRAVRDHAVSAGVLDRILQTLLRPELKLIADRKTLPFGGSCLVSATVR